MPVASKSKREFEQVEMPTIMEAGLDAKFVALAEDILDLNDQKRVIDEQLELKKTLARAYMEEIKEGESWSARSDRWSVSYIQPGPRKTIVPELLIQQGVKISIIQKATKETPSSAYVQFRRSKGEV